jgi:hypothetical protein
MKVSSAIVAALLVIAGAANARAATITFDGVANATLVNNLYAGVTLECVDGSYAGVCTSWDSDGSSVWARTVGTNNVVSTLQTGIPAERVNLTGTIQATFATPGVTSVSIDAFNFLSPEGFGAPGAAFLNAYSNTLGLLGATSSGVVGSWQTLSLSGLGAIDYVQFSHSIGAHASYSYFDNLAFTTGTGGGDPDPMPEPMSAILFGAGLLGVTLRRRFVRRA